MSAEIIQFIPRSNQKPDVFAIGRQKRLHDLHGPDSLELAALEFSIVNQIFPSVTDTAPAEYCCADEKDPV